MLMVEIKWEGRFRGQLGVWLITAACHYSYQLAHTKHTTLIVLCKKLPTTWPWIVEKGIKTQSQF